MRREVCRTTASVEKTLEIPIAKGFVAEIEERHEEQCDRLRMFRRLGPDGSLTLK